MTLLQTVILGIVEGITEFLPVSSTGHLILASRLLHIDQTDFVKSFEIAIQLGAILAALALYWKHLVRDRKTLHNVLAAFVPTAFIGVALHSVVKTWLLGNDTVVVWSLLLGGIALIAFEKWHREGSAGLQDMTIRQSVTIGLFQSLAIIPGVSRSASTVVGGMLTGMNRRAIVDFSFLLAIPTMAAATGLDLMKSAHAFDASEMLLLGIGMIVSFATALLAIRWLLGFIKNHTFIPFGIYRIVAAVVYWGVMLR